MSGIDLLLSTAIDYERTHQIVLFTLLSKSEMPKILLGIKSSPKEIYWEPEKQLFDLAVNHDDSTTYIEIKMWSSLTDGQFNKQVGFLKKQKARGIYLLLGTSWFEHTQKDIERKSQGTASRIGYDKL